MKNLFLVSVLILSLSVLYFGCDKDNGTESEKGSLTGTWKATQETIPNSAGGGSFTITPSAALFMNLIVTLNEDGTCSYQSWNGNITAEQAKLDTAATKYEEGVGSWNAGETDFTLQLGTTYIGTYKLEGNKLTIDTAVLDPFTGSGAMLPVSIVMEKQ